MSERCDCGGLYEVLRGHTMGCKEYWRQKCFDADAEVDRLHAELKHTSCEYIWLTGG